MWLLILEALLALALLCGAVWWTFSGRRRESEPEAQADPAPGAETPADPEAKPGAGGEPPPR